MADASSRALVVLGGSAGGLEAAGALLRALPGDFAAAVVVALHRGRRGADLARALSARAGRAVVEPVDKEPILAGGLYLAPGDYHLLVERGGAVFALSADEPVHYCRPAIDPLLESAAWALGAGVTAVILSGANQDGAAGVRAVKAAGGRVWVQSPTEAFMPVMPSAALESGPVDGVGPLAEIARRITEAHGG